MIKSEWRILFYVAIWIITLFISIYLFKIVSGSLSILKPNLISITFYYSLLVTSFIGALLIVLDIDEHYMLTRLHNDDYREIGFYLICYIMIFMPLTMLLVTRLVGFNAHGEFHNYLKKKVSLSAKKDRDIFILMTTLSLICFLAVVYMIFILDKIPIVELFRGASNLDELRINAGRGFEGNIVFRNIFALGLPPVLSLIAYIYAIKTKSLPWWLLFLMLFGMSIFVSVYDLQKAPIFFYVLMFILVNIYIGKLTLNFRWISVIGVFGFSFLLVMYIVIGNTSLLNLLSYNTGPIGRMILSQISPFFLHLELFGDKIDPLMGKSLPNIILNLYDIEQVRSARLVMEMYYPEKVEAGIAGVLNTIFAGEAFANFGYAGIILGTMYMGLFVQIIYILFIRLPKSPILISLFVYFTVNIPRVLVGGFTDFVFNPYWVFLFILFVGILILSRFKQEIHKYYSEIYMNQKS